MLSFLIVFFAANVFVFFPYASKNVEKFHILSRAKPRISLTVTLKDSFGIIRNTK